MQHISQQHQALTDLNDVTETQTVRCERQWFDGSLTAWEIRLLSVRRLVLFLLTKKAELPRRCKRLKTWCHHYETHLFIQNVSQSHRLLCWNAQMNMLVSCYKTQFWFCWKFLFLLTLPGLRREIGSKLSDRPRLSWSLLPAVFVLLVQFKTLIFNQCD